MLVQSRGTPFADLFARASARVVVLRSDHGERPDATRLAELLGDDERAFQALGCGPPAFGASIGPALRALGLRPAVQ